jgi:gamma-glutamyltranspeptidase / glutathione hydrolase
VRCARVAPGRSELAPDSVVSGILDAVMQGRNSIKLESARRGRRIPTQLALWATFLAMACGREWVAPQSSAESLHVPPVSAQTAPELPSQVSHPAIPGGNSGPPPALTPGGRAARGLHGMVVSVEPHATRAGVRILEAGGNAIDAAVATAYALAVTHPSAGNIGGGGFMLVAKRGEPIVALDFRERAPDGTNKARFQAMVQAGATGPAASGVPGSVAGFNLAQRRFGRLSLPEVLAPAIELARRGHHVGARQALTLRWSWPHLKRNAEARRIFGTLRGPVGVGERLLQPDLASTLERIARDGDLGFYAGPTAQAIVQAMGPLGLIREQDLREYRAVIREPLRFGYRGYEVTSMPPPSSGGVAIAQILLSLERLGAQDLPVGSADELHLFAEVSKRAQALRRFDIVDPEGDDAMTAAGLLARLSPDALLGSAPPYDPTRATPSSRVHPLYRAAQRELEHTTHLSVVDAEGNAVSCTTTLSAGFGARYVVGGTGVIMNNSLAAFGSVGLNLPKGGRRMLSSMAPTLVSENGRVVAVLGSPGGDTIPSTIVQVLRHLIDHGMTLDAAVEAPRIHHGFVPDELRLERARPLPADVLAVLRARGHALQPRQASIGHANNIIVVAGVAYGHADSREGGLALAPKPPPQ